MRAEAAAEEAEIDRLPIDLLAHIFTMIASFTDLAQLRAEQSMSLPDLTFFRPLTEIIVGVLKILILGGCCVD